MHPETNLPPKAPALARNASLGGLSRTVSLNGNTTVTNVGSSKPAAPMPIPATNQSSATNNALPGGMTPPASTISLATSPPSGPTLGIIPTPGFVIKTHRPDFTKVFINVYHSDAIRDPLTTLTQQYAPTNTLNTISTTTTTLDTLGIVYTYEQEVIPVIYFNGLKNTLDKHNQPCLLYEVVISTQYFVIPSNSNPAAAVNNINPITGKEKKYIKPTDPLIIQKVRQQYQLKYEILNIFFYFYGLQIIEALNSTYSDTMMEDDYVRPKIASSYQGNGISTRTFFTRNQTSVSTILRISENRITTNTSGKHTATTTSQGGTSITNGLGGRSVSINSDADETRSVASVTSNLPPPLTTIGAQEENTVKPRKSVLDILGTGIGGMIQRPLSGIPEVDESRLSTTPTPNPSIKVNTGGNSATVTTSSTTSSPVPSKSPFVKLFGGGGNDNDNAESNKNANATMSLTKDSLNALSLQHQQAAAAAAAANNSGSRSRSSSPVRSSNAIITPVQAVVPAVVPVAPVAAPVAAPAPPVIVPPSTPPQVPHHPVSHPPIVPAHHRPYQHNNDTASVNADNVSEISELTQTTATSIVSITQQGARRLSALLHITTVEDLGMENGQQLLTEEMLMYESYSSLNATEATRLIDTSTKNPKIFIGWQVVVYHQPPTPANDIFALSKKKGNNAPQPTNTEGSKCYICLCL